MSKCEGCVHMPHPMYEAITRTVSHIPRGRVATYGQIADLAGIPGHARLVGYALHALPPSTSVPWHRVINARGEISLRPSCGFEDQRQLLEDEGVSFEGIKVPLQKYRWIPKYKTVRSL